MNGQTRKCPICGQPYKVFNMTTADQSACPECVREAERRIERPTPIERDEYRRRRREYFGGR